MPHLGSLASAFRVQGVATRGLIAALAGSALVIGCLEPLAAEAHDGDATINVATIVVATAGADAPAAPVPPVHDMHLCHCTHAHGASTLPSAEVTVVVSMVDEAAPRRPLMAPSSVTLDGLMRPPASARG